MTLKNTAKSSVLIFLSLVITAFITTIFANLILSPKNSLFFGFIDHLFVIDMIALLIALIMFIGQVSRIERDREAQQEIDYREMFRPLTKWVAEISDADRIPEYVSHAFHIAQSGRPGPVVLSLPEDMLVDRTAAEDARPVAVVRPAPAPAAIAELHRRLAGAERPLVIVGGSARNPKNCTFRSYGHCLSPRFATTGTSHTPGVSSSLSVQSTSRRPSVVSRRPKR